MDAVILIGVPGAGKSTLYRERFSTTHVRVSLDEMKTREKELKGMQECIANLQPFVVDDTNVRIIDRQPFIAAARAAGYRVRGYFFRLELRAAIKRNSLRTGKQVIPVPALIRRWKQLEPPALAEGFDELNTVSVNADGQLTIGL